MTLQSSGAISLADIQTEFGGSNPISLSEYYGVASGIPASGNPISIGDFYGKSSYLDQQTVTVGNFSFKGAIYYGYTASWGSISDGTFNVKSGAVIRALQWGNSSNSIGIQLLLEGVHANSGWTTMNIAGTNYTRTAMTFSTDTSNNSTTWTYSTSTNPFGTTVGATKVVTFT